MVKNLPAMQETQVRSWGQEDPLEKEMATYSSILAGEFHGQRSLTGYSSWGCKESDTTERLSLMLHVSYGLPMLVASLHQGTHVDRVPSGWTLLDKGKENLINQPGF